MRCVVGLGNPETRYFDTRHNLGWRLVDRLCKRHRFALKGSLRHSIFASGEIAGVPVVLAKPVTFMNRSGRAVLELVRRHELPTEDLLIVSDDTTLPLGSLRIRSEGSAGGHNGLRSVQEVLGGVGYPRMRLGVGNAEMDRWPLEDFVLHDFRPDEEPVVENLLEYAADAVCTWIVDGIDPAISRFNRRVSLDE